MKYISICCLQTTTERKLFIYLKTNPCMDIENNLKELNLDENQIKIYLACLNLGSSKVHDISKKSNMIRTTIYGILKSLMERGLVSTTKKDNVTFYQASSPKHLLSLLDEKREKINKIIPELEKLQAQIPKKHYYETFEGKEGLKTIINDLLQKPNETIFIIGFVKKWIEFSEMFSDIYYRKKKERKIKSNVLIDKSEISEIKNKKIHGSEFRFVDNLESDAECFIYGDKIAFVSFEENNLRGVIIQDLEMTRLQKNIFGKIWETAKKVPKI
jgi:sugar-specific transcriptional regulator TrmB